MGITELHNHESQISLFLDLKHLSSKGKAFVFGCSNSFVLCRNHDKQARDIKIDKLVFDYGSYTL